MTRSRAVLSMIVLGCIAACSGKGSSGFGNNGGSAGSSGSAGTAGVGGSSGSGGSGGTAGVPSLGGDGGDGGCGGDENSDIDRDGWTPKQGDCNDCDPTINPGAYDIPKDGIDEDCDGTPDNEVTICDSGLALDSNSATDAAKAIDLCRTTTESAVGKARTWGVISAEYVFPDGTTSAKGFGSPMISTAKVELGHGLLSAFGVNNVQNGVAMLGISSGTARQPVDPGWHVLDSDNKGYTTGSPPPYPKSVPACGPTVFGLPHDGMALQVVVRVPTNAKTLSFNENFFSFEFPDYICSSFNDTFVVMMTPKTDAMLPDDNIAFDSAGNPISVNNALLQVCKSQNAGGKFFACPLGVTGLNGTGFDKPPDDAPHAATGWLTTTAPVDTIKGQDVTLLFAIWDSSDGNLDSTALIDNFTWGFEPPTGVTTTPTPMPK